MPAGCQSQAVQPIRTHPAVQCPPRAHHKLTSRHQQQERSEVDDTMRSRLPAYCFKAKTVSTRGGGLLQEIYRCRKKRQTEGVMRLPPATRSCDTGERESETGQGHRDTHSGYIVQPCRAPADTSCPDPVQGKLHCDFVREQHLRHIFETVSATGKYNFAQARCPVPSALNIATRIIHRQTILTAT